MAMIVLSYVALPTQPTLTCGSCRRSAWRCVTVDGSSDNKLSRGRPVGRLCFGLDLPYDKRLAVFRHRGACDAHAER